MKSFQDAVVPKTFLNANVDKETGNLFIEIEGKKQSLDLMMDFPTALAFVFSQMEDLAEVSKEDVISMLDFSKERVESK
ncbi:hypothetical protein M3611_26560 [Priestia megaterium]|uniref:hypothetical protein n=1 Tax=Priestia megaterium TaxID=1404 RepID=UPI00203D456E|nr:hypothetical protein [Priestia megaterium]MCM3155559.1 hypothetical protein [Priestia megaterium]